MEIFVFVPLAPYVVIAVAIVMLGFAGVLGLADGIMEFLHNNFEYIAFTIMIIILVVSVVTSVYICRTTKHKSDMIFIVVNIVLCSIIGVPSLFMFLFELAAAYNVGFFSMLFLVFEGILGLVIAGVVIYFYYTIGSGIVGYLTMAEINGVLKFFIWILLTTINVFLVYKFYILNVHLFVDYFTETDELEIYKQEFSSLVNKCILYLKEFCESRHT